MIKHFIIRDFITYKFFWVILVIFSALVIPLVYFAREFLIPIGYGYFFFAMIPAESLTGVTWRSQHVMSRNYLLSLPVRRNSLFRIIQVRALVFCIPFIVYALMVPFASSIFAMSIRLSVTHYPMYVVMLLLAVIWMNNQFISMQLSTERITSYLTQQQRTRAWIGTMGIYLGELFLVGACFVSKTIGELSPIIPFVLVAVLAAIRYSYARKRWLGQQ